MAMGLLQAGAGVAIAARSAEQLAQRAEELRRIGGAVVAVTMDCSDPRSVAEGLDEVEKSLGPVDILVSAAGGNLSEATATAEQTFFDLPVEALRAVVDLNLMAGALIPCQVVGRRMAERHTPASIILVTSVSAERPLSRVGGYSAAKAAVGNLTQWLACHFARDLHVPVRVNAIMPGFFLTEQNRYMLLREGELTERARDILDHTPMGRFGRPEDLAGATVFLASDAASFVTGSVLAVDGGFTAFAGV
jgi:NAD(P)-dependent dehydrogenase (short-subunit alcohol dehydrogenase family)